MTVDDRPRQIEVPLALVGAGMLEYLDDGQEVVIVCTDEGAPLLFEPPKRVACKVCKPCSRLFL